MQIPPSIQDKLKCNISCHGHLAKVAAEDVRLAALNLSVLDGNIAEVFVKLGLKGNIERQRNGQDLHENMCI